MHTPTVKPMMLIIIIGYFIAIGALGILSSKKENQESMKDFALAGKGLGSFVLIGTFLSSWLGGGAVTGSINSLAYTYGIGPSITYIVPSIIATVFLYCIGPIVRKREKMTTAALLEDSYGKSARIVSAVIIALASFSIVSFQYRGLGIVLNATTGISINVATAISCALIVILAVSGGMRSVAITDAVSSVFMLVGLAIGVPFILHTIGGWDWVVQQTAEVVPKGLTLTGGWKPIDYLSNLMPTMLLALGDQNLYQRMAAAKDDKSVQIGMIGWALGMVVVCPIISVLGYLGRLYFGDNIIASQSMISITTICPWVIGGIMLAAASAFIVTTGDSYLLSGATNISSDVYKFLKKDATERQQVNVTRWSIVICGVLALGILNFFPDVLAVQYWSFTIVGAGITPSLLGAVIFPKRVTKWGGLTSMIVGTVLTIAWEMMGQPFGVATVLVAFPVSACLLIVVSALTQKRK